MHNPIVCVIKMQLFVEINHWTCHYKLKEHWRKLGGRYLYVCWQSLSLLILQVSFATSNDTSIFPPWWWKGCVRIWPFFALFHHARNFQNIILALPSRPAHLQLSKVFLETQSELSLIGEIDGFVGLLLGISINQMTNLLDIIVNAIARIYSHFKLLRKNI